MQTIVYDFSAEERRIGYNFDMPNTFFVQISNQQEPCKIVAEKIEEQGMQNSTEGRLVFKTAKDEIVGNFRSTSVIGWWKLFS